jgi:hypothetical protein
MKSLLSIGFLFVITQAGAQKKEFGWLIGTWQQENKMSFEVWQANATGLSGSAYQLDADGGKNVIEEIKLIKKGNDFYYIPDVAGPQGEIAFKITSMDDHGFTAENLLHDFPKVITYKLVNAVQMIATISGGKKSNSYAFKKIK